MVKLPWKYELELEERVDQFVGRRNSTTHRRDTTVWCDNMPLKSYNQYSEFCPIGIPFCAWSLVGTLS